LKGVLNGNVTFADYFPHVSLGDRSSEDFLENFKFQHQEYDQKVFDFILRDYGFQNLKAKSFRNHQLWSGQETITAKTIKYKLLHPEDKEFLPVLKKGLRLRLDSNGMFSKKDYEHFLENIPPEYHKLIDYIEDPLAGIDWSWLDIPSARDFIEGSPFDFYIFKPNCEFKKNEDSKTVYSSYLGSEFGQWHAYCEMTETADLSLPHGIVTAGFYEEERNIWNGTYDDGLTPNSKKVKSLYQDLSLKNWKLLCSI
jgi:hypothetical protein